MIDDLLCSMTDQQIIDSIRFYDKCKCDTCQKVVEERQELLKLRNTKVKNGN